MAILISTVLLFCVLCSVTSKDVTLKQVVILSRHNVRTPLAKELNLISPKKWPQWNEKRGFLTAKGALLEGYLGEYFYEWLEDEGLWSENCPDEKNFYVYANLQQRTMATADAFVKNAFPRCNITIHHSKDDTDPIFNPIIHNTSKIFRQNAKDEMRMLLKQLHINSSYEDIGKILDYKNSEFCLKEGKCELTTDKNQPILVTAMKPNVNGPLKICNSAVDSFIMENYEGFPLHDVAWGQLTNTKQWDNIIDLSRSYHYIIFSIPSIAKDISKPLIQYLSNFFLDENSPKVTLVMGHDANMYTVLKSMGFKSYSLKKQFELVPAGGKIVFQKWNDAVHNRDLLKIEFVYLSTKQMRDGLPLSMDNLPERMLLELEGCSIDKEGYCLWEDFVALLATLL